MVVDHHSEGSWYIPSLHHKYSIGWNITIKKGFLSRPYACNIRFFGMGLESTLSGFEDGGFGYLEIAKTNAAKASSLISHYRHHHSGSRNETERVHCYYMTNKGHGSNFQDTPKTFGLAIYCPISLDLEAGEYAFKGIMETGYYCRALADSAAEVSIHLRPSPSSSISLSEDVISSSIETNPSALRLMAFKSLSKDEQNRVHAVCTVQTFRNKQTRPMLYLFTMYYQMMGWSVIIYDRYGFHKEYLSKIMHLPGVYYHPYTVFQLSAPNKYNSEHASKQSFGNKYYYKMEKNWVKGYGGEKADTADQDMDKTKTYDHCRLEYHFMQTMLFADADEFFFCPQPSAASSVSAQRGYQTSLLDRFMAQGIEEMRFIRLPYAGIADPDINNTAEYRATVDLTLKTQICMEKHYNESGNVVDMLKCWSSASTYDDFPKSADLAGVCPFHYNHWSCDGGRGGGRDWGKTCRCKVAFDMMNHYAFKPVLNRCHMLHFNDNKYRFQLIRDHGTKKRVKFAFTHDNGDITAYNPIARMFSSTEPTHSSK